MDAVDVAEERRALREALALARLGVAVARVSTAQEVARVLLDEIFAAVPDVTAALALLDDRSAEFEHAVRALAAAMNGRTWAANRAEGGAEVGLAVPILDGA